MNNVINYINYQYIIEDIESETSNYIFEKLNSSILRELANQLTQQKNDEKEKKRDDNYASIYSKNFKEIFARRNMISWDKISDEDFIEYKFNGIPKNDNALNKLVRSVIKGDKNAIVFVKNEDTDLFEYVIFTYGEMIKLTKKNGYGDYPGENTRKYSGRGRNYTDYNQKEKLELINGKTIYIMDKQEIFAKDAMEKHNKRNEARNGMVLLDEYSLKNLAERNRKRYQEMAAKIRANKMNNDKLLDECNELIKKSSDIAIQVAKDPSKYADILSDVSNLTIWIYDSRRYVSGSSPRKPGYYTGVNGLLPTLAKYSKNLKDIQASGGYSFQRDELKKSEEDLKKAIEKIKEYLEKIEPKL